MTIPVTPRERAKTVDRLGPGDALVIGLLMASTFLVLLNEMLLGVALPTLISELGITPSAGQWLTTGYLLTLAVLIPATGFVMRRFHLRTIFLTALSVFIVGTALAAVAPSFVVLLVGRIVQAVGTAVFVPLLMTTAIRLVPESRRGRTMALVTAVPALAPAVGPAVSGLILTFLPWRGLFLLVLPLAVIALIAGAVKLKNITTPERASLDLVSLALSAVGFGGLILGLSVIGESASGHAPLPPLVPILIGVVGVAGFVFRQVALRRRGAALLDMGIFRSKTFSAAILVMLFVAMNGFGVALVLPLVLTGALGLSTLAIGFFLFPGGLIIAGVSAVGGRVYDRWGPVPLLVPGAVIWAVSISFLSTLSDSSGAGAYLAGYLVMTAGQAMIWGPVTTLALSSLRSDLHPHGSAAFTTVQQLAGAVGGAVLVSAYTIGAGVADAGQLSVAETISAGQSAFMTGFIIALAGIVGTLFVWWRRRADAKDRSRAKSSAH
jgi:DHA2 family lincomycin resistance protein-like MFS transporter